jgi:beta-fructofuranosidase
MVADGKEIQLQPADIPQIHAFVDGSVIETIVSQRIGFTKRFYYAQTTAPDIQIRITGGPFTAGAWNVTPISNDRLTTPAHQV